jgi:hypothetical protein
MGYSLFVKVMQFALVRELVFDILEKYQKYLGINPSVTFSTVISKNMVLQYLPSANLLGRAI